MAQQTFFYPTGVKVKVLAVCKDYCRVEFPADDVDFGYVRNVHVKHLGVQGDPDSPKEFKKVVAMKTDRKVMCVDHIKQSGIDGPCRVKIRRVRDDGKVFVEMYDTVGELQMDGGHDLDLCDLVF